MAHIGKLPKFQRLITGHDKNGKTIITDIDTDCPAQTNVEGGKAAFFQTYATTGFPVDLNEDKDLEVYKGFLEKPPGIVVNSGTVMRVVDVGPGNSSPMHRTVSLDYGIVLIGEIELELDSGEKRLMKPGDICVQRGTNHRWRNVSTTEWSRMVYFLQPCQPVTINGKPLGEDYGGMEGMEPSH